ncbi:MAG: RsmE family RNA methyltransferase [Candidatus Dormibacteria bacterium]
MIRVFIEPDQLRQGLLVLEGDEARHVGGALRVRPGEELIAVSPDGFEHHATVRTATSSRVECEVVSSSSSTREPAMDLRVCQALLKGDQFERILEYGSELGVGSFQPMLTERTVPRVEPARLSERTKRWEKVVRGGAQLGQRGRLPTVLPALPLADALGAAKADGMQLLLLYEGGGLPGLDAIDLGNRAALIVGPEGGWTEAEVRTATDLGAVAVTLGPRIMRPLPAVMTAVAAVFLRTGDLKQRET